MARLQRIKTFLYLCFLQFLLLDWDTVHGMGGLVICRRSLGSNIYISARTLWIVGGIASMLRLDIAGSFAFLARCSFEDFPAASHCSALLSSVHWSHSRPSCRAPPGPWSRQHVSPCLDTCRPPCAGCSAAAVCSPPPRPLQSPPSLQPPPGWASPGLQCCSRAPAALTGSATTQQQQ